MRAMQPITPSQIATAFELVGRDAPLLDHRTELARALDGRDLDDLIEALLAKPLGASLTLRVVAWNYQAALAEAADHTLWISRLEAQARQRDEWAAKSEVEAVYRRKAAALAGDDTRQAADETRHAEQDESFAKYCRDRAAALRAQADGLVAKIAEAA